MALLLALSAPAAGAEEPLRLVVSVTDHANVRGLERAQAYVERVFSAAGVAITWKDPSVQSCPGLTLFLARTSPGVAMGRAAVRDGVSWVFPNRVISLAAAKNMDERVMLGRAIVHELGHLLGLEHVRDGVMRAEIYTDAMEAKFVFTPAEARAIRERLESNRGFCSE